MVDFCLALAHIGEQDVICLSVNSKSSLSFKARGLKICIHTPHINGKKVTREMHEICLRAEIWRFFYSMLGWANKHRPALSLTRFCLPGIACTLYEDSVYARFQLSSLKTEGGHWGNRRRVGGPDARLLVHRPMRYLCYHYILDFFTLGKMVL